MKLQTAWYIQATPPEDVVQALEPEREELERSQEETRLILRYYIRPKKGQPETIGTKELEADIASARVLLENPSSISPYSPWDAPALVAEAALKAHVLNSANLPDETLAFVADTVLQTAEDDAGPKPYEFEETYFEQGGDRTVARALPLLLMPAANSLREMVEEAGGLATFERAARGCLKLAQAVPQEVRLHLARGLDHVWRTPCAEDGSCHHEAGWRIATETMRDCVLGAWMPGTGRRRVLALDEPFAESLPTIADDSILIPRLDAAIRALAPAATANICVSTRARDLLMTILAVQQRVLINNEHDMDQRGNHTLVSARALLTLAQQGDEAAIFAHINSCADNSAMLRKLLRGLSAAGEETPDLAGTARRIWPNVLRHVLELNNSGHTPFHGPYDDLGLASLIPNLVPDFVYLYREVQQTPIAWWKPYTLRSEVEAWLEAAAGSAECVDQLISFLDVLAHEDQVRTGLPWVAKLVRADPARIAGRTHMLSTWLIEARSAAGDAGLLASWQEVVDALVVAGDTRLAPYSE